MIWHEIENHDYSSFSVLLQSNILKTNSIQQYID